MDHQHQPLLLRRPAALVQRQLYHGSTAAHLLRSNCATSKAAMMSKLVRHAPACFSDCTSRCTWHFPAQLQVTVFSD